jgi:hypothetical protein
MTEDGDGLLSRFVVLRKQQAAEHRMRSQQIEQAR